LGGCGLAGRDSRIQQCARHSIHLHEGNGSQSGKYPHHQLSHEREGFFPAGLGKKEEENDVPDVTALSPSLSSVIPTCGQQEAI
jgi:hypothetical protein